MVIHTAKPVGYTVDGFCEKNKDEVAKPIILSILNSKNQNLVDIYIQKIFDHEKGIDYFAEAKQKKENFIGYKFRQQMDALMTELRSCQCSFMRCLKPNEVKSATVWCPSMVVNQIRYLGLLDSIKIRKESYPFRFAFMQFVFRYLELEPQYCSYSYDSLKALNPDWVQLSKNICKNGIPEIGTDFLLFGSTRVFMKSEAYEKLETVYSEAVKLKKAAVLALDKLLL
jgi:myosin heavy subunit